MIQYSIAANPRRATGFHTLASFEPPFVLDYTIHSGVSGDRHYFAVFISDIYTQYTIVRNNILTVDNDKGMLKISIAVPIGKTVANGVSPYTILMEMYSLYLKEYTNNSDENLAFTDDSVDKTLFNELLSQYNLTEASFRLNPMKGTDIGLYSYQTDEEIKEIFKSPNFKNFTEYKEVVFAKDANISFYKDSVVTQSMLIVSDSDSVSDAKSNDLVMIEPPKEEKITIDKYPIYVNMLVGIVTLCVGFVIGWFCQPTSTAGQINLQQMSDSLNNPTVTFGYIDTIYNQLQRADSNILLKAKIVEYYFVSHSITNGDTNALKSVALSDRFIAPVHKQKIDSIWNSDASFAFYMSNFSKCLSFNDLLYSAKKVVESASQDDDNPNEAGGAKPAKSDSNSTGGENAQANVKKKEKSQKGPVLPGESVNAGIQDSIKTSGDTMVETVNVVALQTTVVPDSGVVKTPSDTIQ